MADPTTTLAVVPHERWSLSVVSLDAVLAVAPETELIYVDGGSPEHIAEQLETRVLARGGTYLRRDRVMTTQEARNLAVAESSGDLIVFADNDVAPEPGWFEALVDCAVETGAGAVCALITQGTEPGSPTIHHAHGDFRIEDGVVTANAHGHYDEDRDDVDGLVRGPTNQIEFHSMLVRRAMLDDIGPFDEGYLSMGDHEDLALMADAAGWSIWFEPTSVVTYLQFAPLEQIDHGLWQTRWSEEWNEQSLAHLAHKWSLRRDSGWVEQARWWSSQQRMQWWPTDRPLPRLAGKAFRRFAGGPSRRAQIVRSAEDRIFCRAGRTERARREAALSRERQLA